MSRSFFLIFLSLFTLAAIKVSAQPIDKPPSELKLYCGAVTTQIGWSGTLPYTLQMCPRNDESCNAEKRPFSLQPASGRADSDTHCWFSDEPVKFRFEFNSDYTGGRDYVAQDLVPIAFDWRGLYPDVWCLEDAAAYFTDIGGRLALRAGYFNEVKRKACNWNAPDDPTLPPPNSDLPREVVGAWVPKGKECPGFFDDASRTGELLWVQPHGIERADGACWLTGLFPLTPTLPVDALCRTAKGYERTRFTFDRIDGETMRLREGRGRRVTYKRCEKGWFVDPEQKKAADKLKGQTLSFVLDLDTEMRSVKSGKTTRSSQERKIEFQVGDDWTLTDRMQIGDSVPPKTFKTRFGEIAIDSAGDRATWLVEDNKLKRVRERKGYYEILSWPLNFDSRTVKCQAEMKLVPTRADGKLRTLGTDRAEYDVIKANIKGQRCPTEPLSFAVAEAKTEARRELQPAKHGEPETAEPTSTTAAGDKAGLRAADECIVNKTIGKAGAGATSRHYLSFTNDCPFEPIVAVRGPWLRGRGLITPAPSKDSGLSIGYSWGVNLPAGANSDELLNELEFAALSLEEFRRSCDSPVYDTDPGLRFECFAGAYDEKHRKRDWAIPLWAKEGLAEADRMIQESADKCIKTTMKKTDGDTWRYKLRSENTCAFGVVVRIQQPGTSEAAATVLPEHSARELPVTFDRAVDTAQYLRLLEVSALTLEDYKRSCGAFRDDDQAGALACFGKAYVAKHGEPDWVKEAQTAGGCVDADPDVAIKACTADIAGGKSDGDTLNNRAVAYMQKGQFDLALPDLDKTIGRDPKHYGALINRGIVLMKKKEHRRAIEDLSKAIELAPIPLRPYRQRAEAYAALGEHTKAIKDADESIKIDPKDDKVRKVREASMKKLAGSKSSADAKVSADECLVHRLDKSVARKNSYDLKLINDCAIPIVGMAHGWTKTTLVNIVSVLDANPMGANADLSVFRLWKIKLAPEESPEDVLKGLDFGAVTSTAYAEACGDIKKLSGADQMSCFRKLYDGTATPQRSVATKPSAQPQAAEKFDTSERVHVRHILLKSEDDAKLAEKVLKGGADFAQTAKSLSIDEGTAAKGGDLGWVARGKMLKPFEDVAFALKPGEISVPVKTQFGWHIIKRDER